jgi:hypothetical protein
MTTNSRFLFQKKDGFVRKYGVPPNSVINHHVPLKNVIWRVYITSFSDKTQLDNIYIIYIYVYVRNHGKLGHKETSDLGSHKEWVLTEWTLCYSTRIQNSQPQQVPIPWDFSEF